MHLCLNMQKLLKHAASWKDYVVYIFFALVIAFFSFAIGDKGFLTLTNLFNITRTTSMIVVMAVAMTFVISAGELDLSVGSTAALAALAAGLTMQAGHGWLAGVAAGLLCGLAVGFLNGFLVTIVNIPSFLVTLGMMVSLPRGKPRHEILRPQYLCVLARMQLESPNDQDVQCRQHPYAQGDPRVQSAQPS